MTVLITLTLADTDTGPFNLFSNSDGFTNPFAINVSKLSLTAGYLSSAVPDTTAIIRVTSIGVCTNYVEMLLITTTTTTTSTSTTTTSTTTEIPCGASANSGGVGITTTNINLNSIGGIVIFEFNAQGVPDKMEFIHNGVKKATSGMTTPNAGPFDNVYGTEPTNTIPTDPQAAATDQFIGSSKGTIPTRNADFFTDTGITGIVVEPTFQQLVWWEYTPADYAIATTVEIRITGSSGTSWNAKRLCASSTTTTTTTL